MAQYPAVFAGQRITGELLSRMIPLTSYKTSTTSRASTTTLTADPDLSIELPRTGTWVYEVWLNYTGAAVGSGDLKVRMSYTGTSSFDTFTVQGINTTSTAQITSAGGTAAGGGVALGTNGGNFIGADIMGVMVATTLGGDLRLEWAQNTSSGTATNLRQGSWIRVYQLD